MDGIPKGDGMSKHTEGPWVLDGFNMGKIIRCIVPRCHPDAKHTCGDYEDIALAYGENWQANARLIAAAPDLLTALKRIEDYEIDYALGVAENIGRIQQIARASIAKAEGRS